MVTLQGTRPFLIELFFADGDPNGTIRAKRKNLTSLAFKIPRSHFEDNSRKNKLRKIDGIKSPGIYFLFGKDTKTNQQAVYIGQASKRRAKEDCVLFLRVAEHLKTKDKGFFEEVYFYTISGGGFGATELDYLEHEFCEIASHIPRLKLVNKNSPPTSHVSDSETANLDSLIEEAKLLFSCLHFNIFNNQAEEEIAYSETGSNNNSSYSYSNSKLHVTAQLGRKDSKYSLLKGSKINYSPTGKTKLPKYLIDIREKLLNEKVVTKDKYGAYVLQKDLLCSSPREAASIVVGYSYNRKGAWKDASGNPLEELRQNETNSPQTVTSTYHQTVLFPSSTLTRFVLKNKNKKTGVLTQATLLSDNSEFILKKGSNILFPPGEENFLSKGLKKRKEELLKNGEITQNEEGIFTLQTDLKFNSPSSPGVFVLGSSVNGRILWKTEDGKTFDEVFPKTSKTSEK